MVYCKENHQDAMIGGISTKKISRKEHANVLTTMVTMLILIQNFVKTERGERQEVGFWTISYP